MLLGHDAPALDRTDRWHCSHRRVPLARIQHVWLPAAWDRIQGLLSVGGRGLRLKASLELDELVAEHPALRDIDVTGGKTVPCAWW